MAFGGLLTGLLVLRLDVAPALALVVLVAALVTTRRRLLGSTAIMGTLAYAGFVMWVSTSAAPTWS